MPARWIDQSNAEAYLCETGRIDAADEVVVRELSGGVSNVVLLVTRHNGQPLLVLKQAREQLRVADPWFCSVERIWREVETLEICERAVADRISTTGDSTGRIAVVPRILFCDRENYLYAMTAAPDHQVWKQLLLAGSCEPSIASACGELLGTIHAATWEQSDVARRLNDRGFFDELRVDPYYRHVARHQPEMAPALERLEQSLWDHRQCLVHGDFSPKNILVYDSGLMLVDFEVGHFGDPAFDIGFFLSHLVLKAFRAEDRASDFFQLVDSFWASYERVLAPVSGQQAYDHLVERGLWNLAGCVLARIDGKSKVDYLTENTRVAVRTAAQSLVCEPANAWPQLVKRLGLIS
jgi:5-methylthioribose kinase